MQNMSPTDGYLSLQFTTFEGAWLGPFSRILMKSLASSTFEGLEELSPVHEKRAPFEYHYNVSTRVGPALYYSHRMLVYKLNSLCLRV